MVGVLMNVYFSVPWLLKSMDEIRDEKGDVLLYDLLNKMCEGINNSLGSVNKLSASIDDEDNNRVYFLDEVKLPNRDNIITKILPELEIKPTILAMYSGGLDSLGMIYKLLTNFEYKDYDIHVHHVHNKNIELRHRAAEALLDDRLEALPELGVVDVARYVDERRDEAPEGIGPKEQRDPLTLLQVQDAHRHVEQLILVDLQQLVAREGLEDRGEVLAVVRTRREAGALQRLVDLVAKQRDRADAFVVGGRGEEAHRLPLADDGALLVDVLDGDDVEQHRAVHGREPVALGDVDQGRTLDLGAHLGRQLRDVAHPAEEI